MFSKYIFSDFFNILSELYNGGKGLHWWKDGRQWIKVSWGKETRFDLSEIFTCHWTDTCFTSGMDDCSLSLSLSLYFSLHNRLSGVTPRKMRADWCRRGNEWPLICMLIVRWPLGDCFGAGSMLRGTSEWHPITANTPTAMARMTVYVIRFWKSRPYLSNLARKCYIKTRWTQWHWCSLHYIGIEMQLIVKLELKNN